VAGEGTPRPLSYRSRVEAGQGYPKTDALKHPGALDGQARGRDPANVQDRCFRVAREPEWIQIYAPSGVRPESAQ
jgi:hypothetical protein